MEVFHGGLKLHINFCASVHFPSERVHSFLHFSKETMPFTEE